jgi:hypothetical protein
MTFVDALTESHRADAERSVLLGNGFSIDWNSATFRYSSLFDEAELDLHVDKVGLFDTFKTRDFEKIIELLEASARLADLYGTSDSDLAEKLREDALYVKRGLADVIAARHPDNCMAIADNEADFARGFLSNFDWYFTANYDLLLYWVINRDTASGHDVHRRDGFQWPTPQPANELIWKSSVAEREQRVFHLHGGLHMYTAPSGRLYKLKYDGNTSLVRQVRTRLESNEYFLVVTEGTSADKQEQIRRSEYLQFCHRRLREMTGTMFIHGMALSPNDEHILEAIEDSHCEIDSLYVSLHGDPTQHDTESVIRRAGLVSQRRARNKGRDLQVHFYDAASAHVWR